jgi:translation initiation factor IF-3
MVGEGYNEIIHISEAFHRAEDMGLDLVLVSMDSVPPVVRMQDFKKLEYEKKKAKKASKQTSVLKELQFKVNISDHDLQTKVGKIQEFLERGDKVKVVVRLKGREREAPERAGQLIERIITLTDCKASKVAGPMPIAILESGSPKSNKKPKVSPPAGPAPT